MLAKPDNLIPELESLVKILLKLSPEHKAMLMEALSIIGKTPCNYEELGITPDKYIKVIPVIYGTPGWYGAVPAGIMLIDLFSKDPSELAVLVTLNEDAIQKITNQYTEHSDKFFANSGTCWNIYQVAAAIIKLRLGGI